MYMSLGSKYHPLFTKRNVHGKLNWITIVLTSDGFVSSWSNFSSSACFRLKYEKFK